MIAPADYADAYGDLWSWLWVDDDWCFASTPIRSYLQAGLGAIAANAQTAKVALIGALERRFRREGYSRAKAFTIEGDLYLRASIDRCFMGKGTPRELQMTLLLASRLGQLDDTSAFTYCKSRLGVDCGGFVAAYWGIGVPSETSPTPSGVWGFLPRTFWAGTNLWPDVMQRRRAAASAVRPGDAAVFFKDVEHDNPDIAKQKSGSGWVPGSGSEAFHIALVNRVSAGGAGLSMLEIAESSGASSVYGGNGVNVREVDVVRSGVSQGKWVYAELPSRQRVYFVAPVAGARPDLPETYGA